MLPFTGAPSSFNTPRNSIGGAAAARLGKEKRDCEHSFHHEFALSRHIIHYMGGIDDVETRGTRLAYSNRNRALPKALPLYANDNLRVFSVTAHRPAVIIPYLCNLIKDLWAIPKKHSAVSNVLIMDWTLRKDSNGRMQHAG